LGVEVGQYTATAIKFVVATGDNYFVIGVENRFDNRL
jgi:hypothetical protein